LAITSRITIDASALLALILREPGWKVIDAIAWIGANFTDCARETLKYVKKTDWVFQEMKYKSY
jgi:hypothetical protein